MKQLTFDEETYDKLPDIYDEDEDLSDQGRELTVCNWLFIPEWATDPLGA